MAVFFDELDVPRTEGQRLVRALDPELVRLAHAHERGGHRWVSKPEARRSAKRAR